MKKSDRPPGAFEIPPEGSLGLLALGAVGLFAWRKVRKESGFDEKLITQSKESEIETKKKIEEHKEKLKQKKKDEK
jgi:hypothetical protein